MRRLRVVLLAAVCLVGLLKLTASAQEAGGALVDEPTPESEDLAAVDADVIDATADVAKPPAAETPPPAWPAVELTPPDLGPNQATIYADGTALIQRRIEMELHVGDNEVTIDGVPRLLVPDSVGLRALDPAVGLTVVEQSGGAPGDAAALLQAATGESIEVRQDGRQVVVGTLLTASDAGLVVQSDTGVHLIPPGGEVVLPPGDAAQGRVVWQTKAEQAGQAELEATWLTGGLSWAADYALTLRPSDKLVSLEGYVRVANTSGAGLEQAGLIFTSSKSGEPAPVEATRRYWLPRPVDLPDGETKRFALVSMPAARAAVRVVAELDAAGAHTLRLRAELKNDTASGLGVPLPPGPIRLYTPDRTGRLQLAGTQKLPAVAVDEPFGFDLGPVEDLELTVDTSTIEGGLIKRIVRLRNLRTEDVTVRLIEHRAGAWKLVSSSATFAPVRDGRASAEVTVPANRALEVRYQIAPPAATAPQE